MQRREFLVGSIGLAAWAGLGAWAAEKRPETDEGTPFDGSTVRQLARQLSQSPYKAPNDPLPDELKRGERGVTVDPLNPIFREVGINHLKSRLRSHPDVAARHHPDLLHLLEKPIKA